MAVLLLRERNNEKVFVSLSHTRYNVFSFVCWEQKELLGEWDKLDCTTKEFVCWVRPLQGLYLLPNVEKKEGMDHMAHGKHTQKWKRIYNLIFIFDFISFHFVSMFGLGHKVTI